MDKRRLPFIVETVACLVLPSPTFRTARQASLGNVVENLIGNRRKRSLPSTFRSRTPAQPEAEKPLKLGRKLKCQYPKMCKSQNRKESHEFKPGVMLMLDELHNWLLLMDLKAETMFARNRPFGPCWKKSRTWFSIPQAFPQGNCSVRWVSQAQSPQGLT